MKNKVEENYCKNKMLVIADFKTFMPPRVCIILTRFKRLSIVLFLGDRLITSA